MNIAMLLEMTADTFGDRVAFSSGDQNLTYAGLRVAARKVAEQLAPRSLKTLAISRETSALTPIALFGAAWAGVTYAPLNHRLPAVVQDQLLHRLQPAELVNESWLGEAEQEKEFVDSPENPAVILFTSGTTADPKAALLQHSQLLAYQFNTVEFGSAKEDETNLLAVPPFHIAGVTALLTSTYTGRRVVALPQFDARSWLDLARQEHATHAFLVPTMLARIVSALEESGEETPPTLQRLSYGGARIPTPVLERALDLFPNTEFVNAYGLTETSSTVTMLNPADHRAAHGASDPILRARLSSAGRPVPGIELRIVLPDGREGAAEEIGEIEVKGDQVSGDYLEAARKSSDWLPTGDTGFIDRDGFLFVEGRGDDTIIRGGENISPGEIENILLAHPAIESAAVVGIADEEWGENIGAMIVTRRGETIIIAELRDWIQSRIGSFKTPTMIVVRDELPLTDTGKVLHRQVRLELEA